MAESLITLDPMYGGAYVQLHQRRGHTTGIASLIWSGCKKERRPLASKVPISTPVESNFDGRSLDLALVMCSRQNTQR